MFKQLLLLGIMFYMGATSIYAAKNTEKKSLVNISKKQLLRMIDTKEDYGKSCESYSYISSEDRVKLIKKKNFMLGDILAESISIPNVDPRYLVESNLTECNNHDINISEYIYQEDLEYLGDNIVTLKVFEYAYGAGAAHGNGHISHYIYNREYGMEMKWEDLFGDNNAFILYILNRVIKEIANKEFLSYFHCEEQLLNFTKPGYFAITDKGLIIQFGKYEIAPGSYGLPSLVVPKKVLKKYMSKNIYQNCFFTKKNSSMKVNYEP